MKTKRDQHQRRDGHMVTRSEHEEKGRKGEGSWGWEEIGQST